MPSTTDYYTQLKAQLEAAATAKKAALDLEYERATTATFDAQGNPTYKKDAAGNTQYGSVDVGYMNQQRSIKTGAEAGNMLRSGQTARDLLTSTAGYKAEVAGKAANVTSEKTAITNETQTELAKYMAMYGTGSAGTSGAGAGAGAGAAAGAGADKAITNESAKAVINTNVIPEKTYTDMTPAEKAAVAARNQVPGGMGATAKPVVPVATGKAQSAAAARAGAAKAPVKAPVKKPAAGNKNYR
jgi:hypothetical protein